VNDAGGGGELVGVADANDRGEAAMIQGLLESAGIPSALQQLGVDGPTLGFGLLNAGGGTQRVLVRASQAEQARSVLAATPVECEEADLIEGADAPEPDGWGSTPRNYGVIGAYARSWAWSVGAMAVAFAVFLLLRTF